MNASAGLRLRCLHAMRPEPLYFVADEDGNYHLPFGELAYRVVIDIHGGFDSLPGVSIVNNAWQVIIECDDRKLVYERVGKTIHGEWVCNLKRGDG